MERRFLRISPQLGINLDSENRATFDSGSGQSPFAAKAEVEEWQEYMSDVLALLELCDPAKIKRDVDLAEQWLEALEVAPEPRAALAEASSTPKQSKKSDVQRGRDKVVKVFMKTLGWPREKAEAQVDEMLNRARKPRSSEDSDAAGGA